MGNAIFFNPSDGASRAGAKLAGNGIRWELGGRIGVAFLAGYRACLPCTSVHIFFEISFSKFHFFFRLGSAVPPIRQQWECPRLPLLATLSRELRSINASVFRASAPSMSGPDDQLALGVCDLEVSCCSCYRVRVLQSPWVATTMKTKAMS